jgi:hypothetical protein
MVLETFSTHTLIEIFSRYFAGTGLDENAGTCRKEHQSQTFRDCVHQFGTLMGK